jgi:hypothetical protein
MSSQDPGSNYVPPPSQTAGVSDVVTQLQNIVRQLGNWITAFQNRTVYGTFKLAAAATTTVTEPATQSNSFIQITPVNASAATLMGSAKALYVSAKVAGASFTVATGSAANAAGTEQFSYSVETPS